MTIALYQISNNHILIFSGIRPFQICLKNAIGIMYKKIKTWTVPEICYAIYYKFSFVTNILEILIRLIE
jgi:hypothetical protein